MKKLLKRIGIILGIFLGIIILFITISYINHKIHLSSEDGLFVPSGQMVEVNNHKMHIYTEGQGDATLVFMSGGGTCSPVLDFNSLYSLLSNKYRVVVVEKAGYGYSEVVDVERDIDTVLSETREALAKAGISGPYVLCPHSMSGIEALYWAQTYPEEVTAIIGLDMAVPEAYEELKININMIKVLAFTANIGINRWIPGAAESDAIKYGTLSDEEKELYKLIFYRRTLTQTMISEMQEIKTSAIKVGKQQVPDIPMLLFSSNGQGTGVDENTWRALPENYLKNTKNGEIINLDCSHYVHDIEYKKIAEETDRFIGKLGLLEY